MVLASGHLSPRAFNSKSSLQMLNILCNRAALETGWIQSTAARDERPINCNQLSLEPEHDDFTDLDVTATVSDVD